MNSPSNPSSARHEQPIAIAVVGHTNAGKTSLLRTLTRRASFGEVSNRPGTTRHVESIDLRIASRAAVRFFDTPGLEDSVALWDYLQTLAPGATRLDRVRAFLQGPEARASFEQEAKVLRSMLEVDAAFYVIDCREPVLPKYRCEIEILASCARPVMPVLNFVRDAAHREPEWQALLRASGLHAQVRFDAVAPFVGSEGQLYHDLATLLPAKRATLVEIEVHLAQEAEARRHAACIGIAELLVGLAALRRGLAKASFSDPTRRAVFVREFQNLVLGQTRACVDAVLDIYGFRRDEAELAHLPWLDGRWEHDLFEPATLVQAGKRLGTGAVVGASIGVVADLAVGGLSLGAGAALGGALGGALTQGLSPLGRRLLARARGLQEITLEDALLQLLAMRLLALLRVLEQRGHAASERIAPTPDDGLDQDDRLQPLPTLLRAARAHPEWEPAPGRTGAHGSGVAARERVVGRVADLLMGCVDS